MDDARMGSELVRKLLENHTPGGHIVAVLDGPKPQEIEDVITGRRHDLLAFVVADGAEAMFLEGRLTGKRIEDPRHYEEVFPELSGNVAVIEAALADTRGFKVLGRGSFVLGPMIGRLIGYEDETTPFRIVFAGPGDSETYDCTRPGVKGSMQFINGPHPI